MQHGASTPQPEILIATSCGESALAALRGANRCEIVARFDRSFYVRTAAGAFVCVGTGAIGNGPLNLLFDCADEFLPPEVCNGRIVAIDRGALVLGARLGISFAAAEIWQPSPCIFDSTSLDVQRRFTHCIEVARTMAPADGLSLCVLDAPRLDARDAVQRQASSGLLALREWLARLRDAQALEPSPALAQLIGLGPGLTPSGDDLLGGVLIALHASNRASRAAALWGWLAPRLATHTSELSAAHLAAAARGQGHEALHLLICAVVEDEARLMAALGALGALGHTSGWDALAGIVLACEARSIH